MRRPIVLEIPFRRVAGATGDEGGRAPSEVPEERRCVEVRPGGERCGRERQGEGERCELHELWWRSVPSAMGMRCPEGKEGVREFLVALIAYVIAGNVKVKEARVALEACRMIVKGSF